MSKKLILVAVLALVMMAGFLGSSQIARAQVWMPSQGPGYIRFADTNPACEGDLDQTEGANCDIDDAAVNNTDDGAVSDVDDGAVNDTDDGAVSDVDDGAVNDVSDGE